MTHYCDQTSLIKRYWPKVNQKQPLLIQVTDTNLFWLLKITNTVLKCWPGKLSIHLLRQVQHPWSVWATYLITNSHQGRQRTGFGASCIVIVELPSFRMNAAEFPLGWMNRLTVKHDYSMSDIHYFRPTPASHITRHMWASLLTGSSG